MTRFPSAATVGVWQEAAALGLGKDRFPSLDLFPASSHLEVKAASVELLLDSYPYGMHSTAGDLLGVGLPMLTGLHQGSGMAARVGAGLLHATGIRGIAQVATVDTQKGYEDRATALAASEMQWQ